MKLLAVLLILCQYLTLVQPQHYSPTKCEVTNYYLTFIKDTEFKVHGLWPNTCVQCNYCGYPTCCDYIRLNYTYPKDPQNFIEKHWFSARAHKVCHMRGRFILFEHEYYKHGSCINFIEDTTDYLDLVIKLYNKYYQKYVLNSNCQEKVYLSLDGNLNYLESICDDRGL